MVNSVQELKDLIVWLKTQKVKSLKIGEIGIEISDYAHLEGLVDESMQPKAPDANASAQNTGIEMDSAPFDPKEEEELLFHSSRP